MASTSISKSVFWQLCGKIALEGIAFFTTPIFTRLLSPSDYGFVSLYISWLSIFCLLIGLSVNGSIGNARIKYSGKILPGYLSSILSISVISFVVIIIILIFFGEAFESIIKIKKSFLILLCIHSFSFFVLNFEITRLDQLKKVEKSTILSLSYSIISIVSSVLFVLFFEKNRASAKIYGQAIPTIVYGFVILICIYVRGKKIWDNEYTKYCLALTLPLIFHKVGHLIFSQSDRIMLQRIIGDDILGIYSVSFSLCSVLTMIYGSLNAAWSPFYFDYKKHSANKDILNHSKRYLKFFTLITVGFILLVYDVYKIMAPPAYYEGMHIIPLFVISNYFSFLYLFPVNFEFFNARTKLIPIATFISALLNIIINILLIPSFGLIGAAIGTMSSHIVLFIIHEIVARYIIKSFEYPWHIYIPGVLAVVFVCLSMEFLKELPILRWILFLVDAIYLLLDILKNKSVF